MSSPGFEGMMLPMMMMLPKNAESFFGWLTVPLMTVFMILSNTSLRETLKNSLIDFWKWITEKPMKSAVIFKANPRQRCKSEYFDAICWFIRKHINDTMEVFEEVSYRDVNEENTRYITHSFFKVSQQERFHLFDDLYGRVRTSTEEIHQDNDKQTLRIEEVYLYSNKKSSKELMDFVDKTLLQYQAYIRESKQDQQLLIECIWDTEKKDFNVKTYPWASLATFETRMFEEKEMLLRQVDLFINGRETFEKRGIPYHLGILLHGAPGCGKTSFIKALANKTKRSIVDIKLTDEVDLEKLTRLILNERLNSDFYLPIEKRLYLFEDIDAMGKMVQKREKAKPDVTSTDSSIETLSITSTDSNPHETSSTSSSSSSTSSSNSNSTSKSNKSSPLEHLVGLASIFGSMDAPGASSSYYAKKEKQTMSTLLNILDGVQENPGRIIVMTTNHIEKLDPAMIRPGRIDINLEFKPASGKIISEIIAHYWNNTPDSSPTTPQELFEKYPSLRDIHPIPHCKVTEVCRMSTSVDDTITRLIDYAETLID